MNMKKRVLSMVSAVAMLLSAAPLSSSAVDNTLALYDKIEMLSISENPATEDTTFDAESFFVVVGTYGGKYTQMRYIGENSVEKVILTSASEEFNYGDVLVAKGDVSMTRVQSAPNDPAYAMVSHYELDEGVELTKVGNCTNFMEKKTLTVTDKTYDGSSHWSMRFLDADGKEFYYGLNTLSSSLGVNVVDLDVGDVCTFAFYNGNVVVPLANIESNDVPGDINGDGTFSISDIVLLQKWLLSEADANIANWKAADLCEDGKLDVFDLCLMKRQLIEKNDVDNPNVDVTQILHSVTDIRNVHETWNGYIARSENELNDIIAENERVSSQDITIDGIDKDFFNNKSVIVVYSQSGAGNQYSVIDSMTIKDNTLNISTITQSPMIATPDMLYRRYIYFIDKNSVANVNDISFNHTSYSYQYEEGNDVAKWYKEWCQS